MSLDLNNVSSAAAAALPQRIKVTLHVLAGVVAVCTVWGNIVVIAVFFLQRRIRKNLKNRIIVSLAFNDCLIGLICMPVFTQYALVGFWPFGSELCILWSWLDWSMSLISQRNVFFVTVDRFLSVQSPYKYKMWRTRRKLNVVIAMNWVLPVFFFFIAIVVWDFATERYFHAVNGECKPAFLHSSCFVLGITIAYFWIPMFVMLVMYCSIFRVLLGYQRRLNKRKSIYPSSGSSHLTSSSQADNKPDHVKKAMRTITFIMGAYNLCWTPFCVAAIVRCVSNISVNVYLGNFLTWLCYINSLINPFAYAFADEVYRHGILRVLQFDCRRL